MEAHGCHGYLPPKAELPERHLEDCIYELQRGICLALSKANEVFVLLRHGSIPAQQFSGL